MGAYTQALRSAINPDFFLKNHGSLIADAEGDRATQDDRLQEVRLLEASLRQEGCTLSFSESFPKSCQRQLASYSVELEVGHAEFSFSWDLNLLFVVFMLFHARFRSTSTPVPQPSLSLPPASKSAHEVETQKLWRSRQARQQSEAVPKVKKLGFARFKKFQNLMKVKKAAEKYKSALETAPLTKTDTLVKTALVEDAGEGE